MLYMIKTAIAACRVIKTLRCTIDGLYDLIVSDTEGQSAENVCEILEAATLIEKQFGQRSILLSLSLMV